MIVIESDDYHRGRIDLLDNLMHIADRTSGAAVWKALFVEALATQQVSRARDIEYRKIAAPIPPATGGVMPDGSGGEGLPN